ncbi:MAG: hypothetical protein C4523_04125 [Myxococcales bacterium]|nr:MAG: hypothetical protein C4523_04125 [Myxococcales bacterium]
MGARSAWCRASVVPAWKPARTLKGLGFGRLFLFALVCFLVPLAACEKRIQKIEPDAVVIDLRITPEEARTGVVKTVTAPDHEIYNMVIRENIPDQSLLKLPPKAAERYPYPLYWRINILPPDKARPDDLLNRKQDDRPPASR